MEQEGDDSGLYKFFQHGTSLRVDSISSMASYSKYIYYYRLTESNKKNLIFAEVNPKKMLKMLLLI